MPAASLRIGNEIFHLIHAIKRIILRHTVTHLGLTHVPEDRTGTTRMLKTLHVKPAGKMPRLLRLLSMACTLFFVDTDHVDTDHGSVSPTD